MLRDIISSGVRGVGGIVGGVASLRARRSYRVWIFSGINIISRVIGTAMSLCHGLRFNVRSWALLGIRSGGRAWSRACPLGGTEGMARGSGGTVAGIGNENTKKSEDSERLHHCERLEQMCFY